MRSLKDGSGEYRFRLTSSNGQVVASGESYPTKAGAKAGAESVQKAAKATTDDQTGELVVPSRRGRFTGQPLKRLL